MATLDLDSLRRQWNDVLYDLEAHNRTAWLALFDGRLALVADNTLTLDFSDAMKFNGAHEFERSTRPDFLDALSDSIERVTGTRLAVTT
jgi:hypothetical protein